MRNPNQLCRIRGTFAERSIRFSMSALASMPDGLVTGEVVMRVPLRASLRTAANAHISTDVATADKIEMSSSSQMRRNDADKVRPSDPHLQPDIPISCHCLRRIPLLPRLHDNLRRVPVADDLPLRVQSFQRSSRGGHPAFHFMTMVLPRLYSDCLLE